MEYKQPGLGGIGQKAKHWLRTGRQIAIASRELKRPRVLAAVITFSVIALFSPFGALSEPVAVSAADASEPTVQIVPSSVTLAPGDVVKVAVVLNNPTDATVTVDDVNVAVPPRMTASTVSGLPWTLAPGSSQLINLDVSADPGMGENSVSIVVKFNQGTSARRVVASLSVKPAAGDAMPEATFVVFPSKLGDGDGRHATVRLTNPTAMKFTNLRLLAVDSDDADLAMPQPSATADCSPGTGERLLTCLSDLAPGASDLVHLEVRAHSSVRTGTQQVSVVLMGTRVAKNAAAPVPEVLAVASHDVELTVFGIDAISPFGIGTLFLLPGLLAIAAFLAAIRWVYPRIGSGIPDKVDPRDLNQMPVVMLGSVLAYLLVWFIWREDLTRRVSTLSVGLLFGLGILIGVVAWMVVALLYRQLVGRRRFRVNAEPEDVLRTLAHRGAGLLFPSYQVNNVIYLHLGQTDGKEFVTPQITFEFSNEVSDDEEKRFFYALRTNDIAAILDIHKDGKVDLDWSTKTGLEVYDPASLPALGNKTALLRQK
ncbi:COG1470 family protein [Arthrobacter sp. PsM3]|uniref:COG1470 family protein n=1 Tax=Arthrobacter sp. PsM3 TaxID=3030531 RepID=UPI00263BA70A|nr:hypothetical protein [Arthrobacter sp. PsM3]MDN4646220.1 hypothetical protein [Arthrobacter sp. PsM3]